MASVAMLEKLAQAKDAKTALTENLGDLRGIKVMGNRVLVAIYIAPEKTKSGLLRATQTIREDVWQATQGLVLKLGSTAFQDEPETQTFFHGQSIEVGEWVVFRPGDGKRVQINGVDCRLLEDTLIDLTIADPELITYRN